MRCHLHTRLKALLAAATVAAGIAMSASAEVVSGVEKNWTVVPSMLPHIVLNRDSSVDFAVDKYGSDGWLVCVHHTNGWGYVEKGVVGSTVNNETFTNDLYQVEGTGDVFRVAFRWWQRSGSASTPKFYGWFTLGTTSDGELTILASEVADEQDVALVGRGEPDSIKDDSGGGSSDGGDTSGGGDAPDDIEVISETPDNIILQWDFTTTYDRNSLFVIPGLEGHFIHGGDIQFETRTNFNERCCVSLDTYKQCMTAWFSINKTGYWVERYEDGSERSVAHVGEYRQAGLYDTIGVALRLCSDAPCMVAQDPNTEFPIDGGEWCDDLHLYSQTLPEMPAIPGSVIHIDDKLWLRYFASENDGGSTTNWQACVGMPDASSNVVERIVDLKAADESSALPSPVGAWTTVRIEAENAASSHGLGFRIWIGGVAAASDDGATVFYARPSAVERRGVAALGVLGNAYLDDLTFFKKHRNPLDGVDINTWHRDLTESETETLAAILGEESLSELQFIDAQDWDSPSDDLAAINCICLGITPAETDLKYTGEILTLKFKNPTLTITAVDFTARTITAKVIPAEGTRVAAPPMPYMFGLTEVYHMGEVVSNEYGHFFSLGYDGFSVDLSRYVKSNGEFTLHFPEWVAPSDKSPLLFRVQIKEYDHE